MTNKETKDLNVGDLVLVEGVIHGQSDMRVEGRVDEITEKGFCIMPTNASSMHKGARYYIPYNSSYSSYIRLDNQPKEGWEEKKYITLPLLAATYRGKNSDLKNMLTHSIAEEFDGGGGVSLCGKISGDNLADSGCLPDGWADMPPSCKRCLLKDPRFASPDWVKNALHQTEQRVAREIAQYVYDKELTDSPDISRYNGFLAFYNWIKSHYNIND